MATIRQLKRRRRVLNEELIWALSVFAEEWVKERPDPTLFKGSMILMRLNEEAIEEIEKRIASQRRVRRSWYR